MIFIPIADFIIALFVLSYIRKTGGFQYLMTTLHKLLFLLLVFYVCRNTLQLNPEINIFLKIWFVFVFLFILNTTFGINQFLIPPTKLEEYNTDGLTEEGKKTMNIVLDKIRSLETRSLYARIVDMIVSFINNLFNDLETAYIIVTNNKAHKQKYIDYHKKMGNDVLFSGMSMFELLVMIKSRVYVDSLVLLLLLSISFI